MRYFKVPGRWSHTKNPQVTTLWTTLLERFHFLFNTAEGGIGFLLSCLGPSEKSKTTLYRVWILITWTGIWPTVPSDCRNSPELLCFPWGSPGLTPYSSGDESSVLGRPGYHNLHSHHRFLRHSPNTSWGHSLSVPTGDPKTSFQYGGCRLLMYGKLFVKNSSTTEQLNVFRSMRPSPSYKLITCSLLGT